MFEEISSFGYSLQCRGGSGVCPDDLITGNGGGSQDIVNITGQVSNGRTCVQYSRSLTTGEFCVLLLLFTYNWLDTLEDSRYDRPILANQSQFIVWAYGPRANEEGLGDLALFHTEFPRNGGEWRYRLINGILDQTNLYRKYRNQFRSCTTRYTAVFSTSAVF